MTANNNNNYTLLTIYQQATIHPFIYLFGTDQYHGSNWCTLFSEVHRGSAFSDTDTGTSKEPSAGSVLVRR
jgi:hypothetical protein